MKAIHFKNERDKHGVLRNLTQLDKDQHLFESGNWSLTADVAENLVGGWIYLHPTKASNSEFGGKIIGWARVLDNSKAHPECVKFQFQAKLVAKGKKWRGMDHTMAWQSGLVDANFEHEASA